MKIMHLSDLHLGKKFNEFSLLEDQEYILQQILATAQEQQPDCVVLAGDIYDKSIPPVEAVSLFNRFITQLVELALPVLVISGNHDSAERLAFGNKIMENSRLYISSAYDGATKKVVLHDDAGAVNFYLLPFIKPVHVKHVLDEEEAAGITSYHEAVRVAVEKMNIDAQARNVLVAHQFVTGAQTAGSESVNVGGLDNIGAEVFVGFNYVALGHIHGEQNISGASGSVVRYSGTSLAYSFSEAGKTKHLTLANLAADGSVELELLPLKPYREVRCVRGTYAEIMNKDFYKDFAQDRDGTLRDLFQITLTDEEDVMDAVSKLRVVYKNLLQLQYDNKRTATNNEVTGVDLVEQKSSLELVSEFYALQNNQNLNEEQLKFVQDLLERLEDEA